MISKTLDELIEKYPNRNRFYSLEWHNHKIKNYKIQHVIRDKVELCFGSSPKELFELACEKYSIDYISEKGAYYAELNIMSITEIEEYGMYYNSLSSSSKYAKDLNLNRKTYYCYGNEYYSDDELALEIIDRMYDNIIFSTKEYNIELSSRSQNTIKITHKRDNTTQNILATVFTEHPLMKEIFSIYAHKIEWESK